MEAFGSLNEEGNSFYQTSMMANSSSGRVEKAASGNPTPNAAEDTRIGARSAAEHPKGPAKPVKRLEGNKAHDQLFRSLNRSVKKVERESRQAKQEQMIFIKQGQIDLQRLRGKESRVSMRVGYSTQGAGDDRAFSSKMKMRTQVIQSFEQSNIADPKSLPQSSQLTVVEYMRDSNAANWLNMQGASTGSAAFPA